LRCRSFPSPSWRHDAFGFRFIRIAEHVAEDEFVFEAAAGPGRSAVGGKFLPEIIDLVLGLSVHVERDRFGELKLPRTLSGLSAANSTLSRVNSTGMTDPTGRPVFLGGFFAITRDLSDLRIFENADVEFHCLLRFRIEL